MDHQTEKTFLTLLEEINKLQLVLGNVLDRVEALERNYNHNTLDNRHIN
jgi:hypothetical protein